MAPSTDGSHNPRHAESRNQDEPQHHHGTKHPAHSIRAVALKAEDGDEDDDRKGNHVRLEERRGDVQAFDGTQDRDGRRDHAVAVEQRRAENPEQDQHAPSLAPVWRHAAL